MSNERCKTCLRYWEIRQEPGPGFPELIPLCSFKHKMIVTDNTAWRECKDYVPIVEENPSDEGAV